MSLEVSLVPTGPVEKEGLETIGTTLNLDMEPGSFVPLNGWEYIIGVC